MPFYRYACPVCNVELTKLQKVNDPAPACPDDEKHGQMAKQLTAPGFHITGEGVYSPGTKVPK